MVLTALEFYAGIGGLHQALERTSAEATVIRAFDWDQNACQVYATNYVNPIENIDISTLTADKLAPYDADLWLMSPSCQPYTVLNPDAKGAGDKRALSFIHIIEDVLPSLVDMGKQPRFMLVENVAGFETSSTRTFLVDTLKKLGYNVLELLLTPLQFGIPNSRLRYYLLAKKAPKSFPYLTDHEVVWRHIPGRGSDWVDPRDAKGTDEAEGSSATIRDFISDSELLTTSPPYIPDRVLEKWGRLFDIVLPSSTRTCCFTRGYTQMVERSGSVLQLNEDLETTTVFDTFLAAKATGQPDAVRILDPLRLRYFTPDELLRLFCFVDESHHGFEWPPSITIKTKYRLLGNSVNVKVVSELLEYLLFP